MWNCKKCWQPQYTKRPDARLCPECGGPSSLVVTRRTCFGWFGAAIGGIAAWLGLPAKAKATAAQELPPTSSSQPVHGCLTIDEGDLVFPEGQICVPFTNAVINYPVDYHTFTIDGQIVKGRRISPSGHIGRLTLTKADHDLLLLKLGDASRCHRNQVSFYEGSKLSSRRVKVADVHGLLRRRVKVADVHGLLLTAFGRRQTEGDCITMENLSFIAVLVDQAKQKKEQQ